MCSPYLFLAREISYKCLKSNHSGFEIVFEMQSVSTGVHNISLSSKSGLWGIFMKEHVHA